MEKKNYGKTNRKQIAYLSIFLFLSLLLVSPFASAQISVSMRNKTLKEALDEIKKQSDYHFFYEDQIANIPIADVVIDNQNLKASLDLLLKNTNVEYAIADNIVYLSMKEQAPSAQVKAQSDKIAITGTVSDEFGDLLIGVSVVDPQTKATALTDINGNYRIEVAGEQSQLQFSYIGYTMQTITVGKKRVHDVVMQEDAYMMNEVVVTALGIKREKKLLGYSIQELKGDEMNQTGNASVAGALQGKIAGVQMNIASTGLNGSNKITIRGNSSFSDNNQPLWVIDGIPYGDDGGDSSVSRYGGIDRGGNSIDLNPDDIETISILKGPNAAALYGSRAGNGVVLITTKKGVGKEGFGVTYGTTMTWTQVAETLEMQSTYGQGLNGAFSSGTDYSYGGRLDGSAIPAWWDSNETVSYSKQGNKLKDYFNTGFSQSHNVSIGNVTEDSNYRLSFGYLDSKGLFEGEGLEKINIDLNSGKRINKYLSMDSKISLSKTRAENRPYFGIYGEMNQLLRLPNNINLNDLDKHHYRTETNPENGQEYNVHQNWQGPTQDIRNPYWIRNQRTNMDERWRMFGYHSMKLNITDWLWVSGKASLDYYRTKIEQTDKGFGSNYEDIITNNTFYKSEQNFHELNLEGMVQGYNNINEKIRVDYTLGINRSYRHFEELTTTARNMHTPGDWYINSAGVLVVSQDGGGIPTYGNQYLRRKQVNSLFGMAQFAYDEYLSFDITARNDWSSTLPANDNSYFYPSFNLSFIGTDYMKVKEIEFPSWWTFGKVRASYAKAGKDTDEYALGNYNTWEQTFIGPVYTTQNYYIDGNLEPEKNTSIEAGLEMKFLDNRLGFDFTYYNSKTDGQIMLVPNTASSTFKYRRVNAGIVKNRGVELALYATPVRTKDLRLDLNFNIAHNESRVSELHKDAPYIEMNRDNMFIKVGAVEGGKLGDIYAKRKIKRNEQGQMIINQYTGLPEVENKGSLEDYKIGNIQPKLMMSFSPQLTYKNIFVSALLDMRVGGDIVSITEAIATQYGTAKRTEDRNEMVILPGVFADGTPNNKEVKMEQYYRFIGTDGGDAGVAEEFIYDASYIKLRELSIGYAFPSKWLRKTPVRTARLSFVARDLCFLWKKTPGTTPEGGFDTTIYSQAMDFLAIPNTRTMGLSLNVSF